MSATTVSRKIVSREEWLQARKALLDAEKTFTRQRDELSRRRRELPWVQLDKDYVFQGAKGQVTLTDLFAGRGQLIVYHFMLGPGWKEGCPSCSLLADHFDGALVHLANRDVSLAVVSRAPFAEIQAFQKRMGWRFPWVSSYESDFNRDFHVSFTPEEIAGGKVEYNFGPSGFRHEEAPGLSVFSKDSAGGVYHTYSAYARGLDLLIGAYNFLDLVPKGRDEDGLAFSMAWVRHHDRYREGEVIDPAALYREPERVAGDRS